MIWSLKFLWYFWTFVVSIPLLLIPGAARELCGKRLDLVARL